MPLAQFVPDDVPLYGVQARGLDGGSAVARSLREMAADYIEQMRRVQPAGPYHVLGWSFGGVAAQEIAVQLQAAGKEVAALVIMDTYPSRPDRGAPDEIRHVPEGRSERPEDDERRRPADPAERLEQTTACIQQELGPAASRTRSCGRWRRCS